LIFDLSSNAIVRTYPIAKTLSKRYDIEIIGPILGKEVYSPYKGEFKFKSIRIKKNINKISAFIIFIKNMLDCIEGDIIYAFKPKLTSFGIGLLAKLYMRVPLILDIEDLETAHFSELSLKDKLRLFTKCFDLHNDFYNYFIELLIPFSNERIVVSEMLKTRFGGTKIPHGVDTDFFDPNMFNKQHIRDEFKLKRDIKIILFSGLPREHKGIEELIIAIKNIDRKEIRLLIVGGDPNDSYYKKILSAGYQFIIAVGPKPHSEMPKYLAVSDIVVLPQRKTPFAMAQVPGKVFEAMAMAKPIISTNVSDLKEILDGVGIIIEPNRQSKTLEKEIIYLLENQNIANELGVKARKTCVNNFNWDKMGSKLYPIFNKYLNNKTILKINS